MPDETTTYVALLRGINVGGKTKVDMKTLKAVFDDLGCSQVSTYINSGNVIFRYTRDRSELMPAPASFGIRPGAGALTER